MSLGLDYINVELRQSILSVSLANAEKEQGVFHVAGSKIVSTKRLTLPLCKTYSGKINARYIGYVTRANINYLFIYFFFDKINFHNYVKSIIFLRAPSLTVVI